MNFGIQWGQEGISDISFLRLTQRLCFSFSLPTLCLRYEFSVHAGCQQLLFSSPPGRASTSYTAGGNAGALPGHSQGSVEASRL